MADKVFKEKVHKEILGIKAFKGHKVQVHKDIKEKVLKVMLVFRVGKVCNLPKDHKVRELKG